MRWPGIDDERDGQTHLFDADGMTGPERGTGRMSGLEFHHVAAKRIVNPVPETSGVPFRWTINAYRGCSHGCVYCFARPTHEYLGLDAGRDFDTRIVVKVNAVEKLRAELKDPAWGGEHIAMGTNTDPYQRAEGKYRLTRGIVETLGEARNPFSILTKSALVTRDVNVLVAAAARTDVRVSFSVGTVDEEVWRATEPGTPHPRRRLDAMRRLADAGVRVGALMAPVLPGLSDRRDQIDATVAAILDAGGSVRTAMPLYLRGATREVYLQWLQQYDPDLHQRYLAAYEGRTHLRPDYLEWVDRAVIAAVERHGGPRSGIAAAHTGNRWPARPHA